MSKMWLVVPVSLFLVLVSSARGILLDGELSCPATSPCRCPNPELIDCANMNLDNIPAFNNSQRNFGHMEVHLQDNNLRTIEALAFAPLNHVVQTDVALTLTGNKIYKILDHSFDLIQNSVIYLNLEHNNLTYLSHAFQRLQNIQTLLLAHNPLHTFDYDVLHSLGRSLTVFSFGTTNHSWPSSVWQLRRLQKLVVDPSQIESIPSFSHVGETLKTLEIGPSNLERLPNSVCSLKVLEKLVFDTEAVYDSNSMLACHHGPRNLKHLVLTGEGLTDLPTNLFRFAPTLDTLELIATSNMFSMNLASVPSNCSVQTLALHGDHLVTVPIEVALFTNLRLLDLEDNPVQCGCLMKWMTTWERRDNVTIIGMCDNYPRSIDKFVEEDLENFCAG